MVEGPIVLASIGLKGFPRLSTSRAKTKGLRQTRIVSQHNGVIDLLS